MQNPPVRHQVHSASTGDAQLHDSKAEVWAINHEDDAHLIASSALQGPSKGDSGTVVNLRRQRAAQPDVLRERPKCLMPFLKTNHGASNPAGVLQDVPQFCLPLVCGLHHQHVRRIGEPGQHRSDKMAIRIGFPCRRHTCPPVIGAPAKHAACANTRTWTHRIYARAEPNQEKNARCLRRAAHRSTVTFPAAGQDSGPLRPPHLSAVT